ncbi:uncharacterized protein LOC5516852 [Nematostella vectensis]|uniref:uncharacterized protein LOC5516852 n=1 Tax=Nematostella vectensis TaxID=45351 RepID=UPI002076FD63|nr:uncharacterized protein LOC5516852 [Nematostella vectensis]XP_048575589.1 uncharacterized protein LOC5516852 [Nematostella vectensis]XP_048575590.1 uncharacterized protein LOC5516852 [Nematostella vectensis]XP_048575591.1 uncharacterized protein LOC5516852 [Nematostella vectensis]XP_048575592.1 uncharacterized protein LOC5516852 [Nematostella vectensis]
MHRKVLGILLGLGLVLALLSVTKSTSCPDRAIEIIALTLPPYAYQKNVTTGDGIGLAFIKKTIKKCFAKCNISDISWNFVNTTEELRNALLTNSTDIAFPILESEQTSLDNYEDVTNAKGKPYPSLQYTTIFESPGSSFIVNLDNLDLEARDVVVASLLYIWPIFLITVILGGIAGVLVWIMEFKFNRSEFPKNFFKGSYEGFWWAFVSMTTVGYGDKTPKTLIGRVFGVIWILIGLVIIGTFTAAATSALNAGSTLYTNGPKGRRVGVFEGHEASQQAIKLGADIKVYRDFEKMYQDLNSAQLHGLLVDSFQASHILNDWDDKRLKVLSWLEHSTPYQTATIPARMPALVGNKCFTEIMRKATRLSKALVRTYVKPIKMYDSAEEVGLFSSKTPMTQIAIATTVGILCFLVLIGTLYQCVYKSFKRKAYSVKDQKIPMQRAAIENLHKTAATLADQIMSLQKQLDTLKTNDELAASNVLENNGYNRRV